MQAHTPRPLALALLPLVLLGVGLQALAQDPEDPRPERPERPARGDGDSLELYPPEKPETLLWFFGLDGEVDEEKLDKGMEALEDPDTLVIFGPESERSRPKSYFAAVESGVAVEEHDLEKALKKGGAKTRDLSWLLVSWRQTELPEGGGGGRRGRGGGGRDNLRRQVISSSSDLRWVEGNSEYLLFYYESKLNAKGVLDRFEKIFTRGGESADRLDLEVVTDAFDWQIEGELDPSTVKKVEKAIAKLDGVTLALIDPVTATLRITARLEDLSVSGPPGRLPGGGGRGGGGVGGSGLRPTFCTLPIFEILEKYEIEVLPPPEEEEEGEMPEGERRPPRRSPVDLEAQ